MGSSRCSKALTVRESEVLTLIASGRSAKQIAAALGISVRIVLSHRWQIQKKLKAHSISDLTRAATKLGFINPRT